MVAGKRLLSFVILSVSVGLLFGCTATAKKNLRFDPHGGEVREQWPVWPKPPEIPRYIYAGELIGESNFIEDEKEKQERTSGFFSWLIGLGREEPPPPNVLQRPQSGMVGSDGRIYVTDVSRQGVFVFDRQAGELAVWTKAHGGATFLAPIGVAQGKEGSILVTDAELGFVSVLDRLGEPIGVIGEAELVRPTGIVRDQQKGLIYVADTRTNNIKVFDDQGRLVDTLGHAGDGQGAFNSPTHIALSGDQLYVTDTLNARVQVLTTDGDLVRAFGKRGVYLGNLSRPKGVTVDGSGNVYVVESYFDHLLIYDDQGRFLLPIGGTGHGLGEFYLPAGIWRDEQDRIYVADMFNGRVVIFQPLGGS